MRRSGAALGPTLCGSIDVSNPMVAQTVLLEPVAQDAVEFELPLFHID
jgi:hypothetical protein